MHAFCQFTNDGKVRSSSVVVSRTVCTARRCCFDPATWWRMMSWQVVWLLMLRARQMTTGAAWSSIQLNCYLYLERKRCRMCLHSCRSHWATWASAGGTLVSWSCWHHSLGLASDKLPLIHGNRTCKRSVCHAPWSWLTCRSSIWVGNMLRNYFRLHCNLLTSKLDSICHSSCLSCSSSRPNASRPRPDRLT